DVEEPLQGVLRRDPARRWKSDDQDRAVVAPSAVLERLRAAARTDRYAGADAESVLAGSLTCSQLGHANGLSPPPMSRRSLQPSQGSVRSRGRRPLYPRFPCPS